MQLTAKLIQLLPLQTGTGKNGNSWKKQDIIVETTGSQYPKKICISVWGDKIDEAVLQIGKQLNISFDVESREYNNRWYTDVKAWKIVAAEANNDSEFNQEPNYIEASGPADDLPF